jgi:NAD-dependent SIR2 family protein deacetylase
MAKPKTKQCECARCRTHKAFDFPDHLLEQIKSGNVIIFAGAGISTEGKGIADCTFYEAICHELGVQPGLSFPALMTKFCSQPDGRIKLLERINDRFDYFRSFDDFYFEMTRFHRAISAIPTINEIITTNWDDFFERECEFDPFVYDSDLAFWDSSSRRVMKIHGSITNLGSIVATESDYRKSFKRLNSGPLGAHLKSLISRKTIIYTGYSLSDENYIKILNKISQMMGSNMRQSYFLSPSIDRQKLAKLPIKLVPIETDGAYFFEQIREHLRDEVGIIKDSAFDACRDLLKVALAAHEYTADYFSKKKHPLLVYTLSYQDGLIHALQRIRRKQNAGDYHSIQRVKNRVHGYEHKYRHYKQKKAPLERVGCIRLSKWPSVPTHI